MQGDWNHAVAEHEDVFDTHLLFLVDVIQPLSAYRIYSVENKATKRTDSARNRAFSNLAAYHSAVSLAHISAIHCLFNSCADARSSSITRHTAFAPRVR